MSAEATDIARVRALTDASESQFDDGALAAVIELYPVYDADDKIIKYDLYRAAADVLEQRAAKVITSYDTSADGATMNRSQVQAQLLKLARQYKAQGVAVRVERDIEYDEDE